MSDIVTIKPQLCKDIPEAEALALDNPTKTGEIKLDGVRTLVDISQAHGVVPYARTGRKFQHMFELQKLEALGDALLDGELITGEGKIADFAMANGRVKITKQHKALISARDYPIRYIVFDILRWQGEDVSQKPWHVRNTLLKEIMLSTEGLLFEMPYSGRLPEIVAHAHQHGYEGVIIKEHFQPYQYHKRAWRRIKFWWTTRVLAVEKTEPTGTRLCFGALLLDGGCKVGQGYTDQQLLDLDKLELPFEITIKHYGVLSKDRWRNPIFLNL